MNRKIKKKDATSETGIVNEFNKIFTNISPELSRKILTESTKIDATMPADSIAIKELKEMFSSLKGNKSPGYDEIISNDCMFLSCNIRVLSVWLNG